MAPFRAFEKVAPYHHYKSSSSVLLMLFIHTFFSVIIFTPIKAAPSLFDGLKLLGNVGSTVNDARNVRASFDNNRQEPYDIGSEPTNGILGTDNILSALEKVGDCDPNIKGVCCVMPNYCVPVAECSSNKVTTNVFDLLRAVPICKCPKGYKGDGRRQGSGCANIDECATGEALCEDLCQDMTPGYACGCRSGFRLSRNGYSCEDIDECAEGIAQCSQLCTNTVGSYTCACRTGYDLGSDGSSCTDIDECLLMDEIVAHQEGTLTAAELSPKATAAMTSLELCDYPTLCVNLPGAYTCHCPLGYKVNPSVPSTCLDIDECAEGIPAQHTDELLSAEDQTAFIPSEGVPIVCTSTNEESIKTPSQSCTNLEGAFSCACASGFELVAEQQNNSITPSNQAIEDYGREVAQQNARFISLTKTALSLECRDIDECLADVDPCTGRSKNQESEEDTPTTSNVTSISTMTPVCFNTIGSYQCECPKGFEHDSGLKSCVDIDECAESQLNLCDENAGEQCVNTVGSYTCQCAAGYRTISPAQTSPGGLIPITCEDIDECLENTHSCVDECRNTPGSYECGCPIGFTRDTNNPHQCIDIDECRYSLCPNQTPCVNLPGTFICGCPKGYDSTTTSTTSTSSLRSQLSKDTQRWLVVMDTRSKEIGASITHDEFRSNLIDWESSEQSNDNLLRLAKLQSELVTFSQCQLMDACSLLSNADIPAICPGESSCVQSQNQPAFYCACPKGSKLSSSSIQPTQRPTSTSLRRDSSLGDQSASSSEEYLQGNQHKSSPPQSRPNLIALPGQVFGGILETGLGLFSGGRILSDDGDIPELPWRRKLSDANDGIAVTVDEVLSPDALLIAMTSGFINNPRTPLTSSPPIPLWLVTHLDWTTYVSVIGNPTTTSPSSLECIDINECIEGINANGALSQVCDASQPCCINHIKAGFTCRGKRGLLLQRSCSSDSIDLSRLTS